MPFSSSSIFAIFTPFPPSSHIRSECGKEFSYASNLRRHVMSSHNKNRFYCQICAKDFSYTSNLRRHMISSHGNEHRVGVFGENGEIEIKDETVRDPEDEDVKELHNSIFTPPPPPQQQQQQQQAVAAICAAPSHSASPRESPAPCVTPNHLEMTNQTQMNLVATKPQQIIHSAIFTTQAQQQQQQPQQQQQHQQQQHTMTATLPGISPMKHMSHNISIQTAPVQIVPLNVPVSGVPGMRAPITTGVSVFRTPNGNIVSTL